MSMIEIVCTKCGSKSFVVIDGTAKAGTAKTRASNQAGLAATDSQLPQYESPALCDSCKNEVCRERGKVGLTNGECEQYTA